MPYWIVGFFLMFLSLPNDATYAQQWPTKPVKVIVPFPPAGATDIGARVIAEKLSKSFGKSFVVENKSGASGVIGIELAARSARDGYTLLVTTDAITSIAVTFKLAFDPMNDLVPIVQLSRQPLVLAVHPSLGVGTVEDLIKLAVARPGMGFATSGVGTQQHITGVWFAKLAGVDIRVVPYKGGGQAINDVVAGQVQIAMLGSAPLLPHYRTGTLKLLAQTSAARASSLQEIPTMAEVGIKGLVMDQWIGLFVPAGTSQTIIDRLNAEVNRALQDNDAIERFKQSAFEPVGGSVAEFTQLVRSDFAKYVRLVKELDIKIEQ